MRSTLSAGQLAVALLSLTPVISASRAWPRWFPEMDALVARQEGADTTSTPPAKASESTTPTPTKSRPKTTDFNTAGRTESADPEETGSDGASKTTKKGGSKTTKGPEHTEFPPQDPPGTVVMTKPAITDPSSIYKIGGDPITWGWNYTNLQGTPTAVDVLISCAAVSRTWTLTQNMTFATAASYKFDTKKYLEEHPGDSFRTDNYKLMIHDADKEFDDPAEPGYLASFSGFQFGMYEPQEYISFDEGWQCAPCSGAGSIMSDVERRAVGGAVAMSVVTVLSFTWFVVGFGGGVL